MEDIQEDLNARNGVLSCIWTREALLERAGRYKGDTSLSNKTRVLRLLKGLRNSSIDVVEAIERWSKAVNGIQSSCKDRILTYLTTFNGDTKPIEILFPDGELKPLVSFRWKGEYYILKMLHDVEFLQEVPHAACFLGRECGFQCNPFLLPYNISELLREGPVGPSSSQKVRMACSEISGIPIEPMMEAVATVAIEEFYYRMNHRKCPWRIK